MTMVMVGTVALLVLVMIRGERGGGSQLHRK